MTSKPSRKNEPVSRYKFTEFRREQVAKEKKAERERRSRFLTKDEVRAISRRTISIDTSKARSNIDVLRICVKELGWKEYPYGRRQQPCDLYWHGISCNEFSEVNMSGKFNRFPGMSDLLSKVSLFQALDQMRHLFHREYDFYPRTWYLPDQYARFTYEAKKMMEKKSRRKPMFIAKPDEGSQGEGIFLINDPANCLSSLNTAKSYVIQEYISRPFLLEKYKFDLRIYVVVMSIDPLKLYICQEGLARFCTIPYEAPSKRNMHEVYMHLSNYSLNKQSAKFKVTDKVDEGSKRTMTSVLRQLHRMGHDVLSVWENIEKMVCKTVIALIPELKVQYQAEIPHDRGTACFQILGFDILLLENLTPILLEVNSSPSMRIDCEVENEAGVVETVLSSKDIAVKLPLVKDTLLLVAPRKKLKYYPSSVRQKSSRRKYKIQSDADKMEEEKSDVDKTDDKNSNINRDNDKTDDKDGNINRNSDKTDDKDGNINCDNEKTDDKDGNINRDNEKTDDKDSNINRDNEKMDDKNSNINEDINDAEENNHKIINCNETTTNEINKENVDNKSENKIDDLKGEFILPEPVVFNDESEAIADEIADMQINREAPMDVDEDEDYAEFNGLYETQEEIDYEPRESDSPPSSREICRDSCLKEIFPNPYANELNRLRIYERLADIFIKCLGVRGAYRLGPTGFRSFTRKCGLNRKGLDNATIDIMFIDLQRKWDFMNPERTTGLGYKGFVDACVDIANRKFYNAIFHDMMVNFVEYCEENMHADRHLPALSRTRLTHRRKQRKYLKLSPITHEEETVHVVDLHSRSSQYAQAVAHNEKKTVQVVDLHSRNSQYAQEVAHDEKKTVHVVNLHSRNSQYTQAVAHDEKKTVHVVDLHSRNSQYAQEALDRLKNGLYANIS